MGIMRGMGSVDKLRATYSLPLAMHLAVRLAQGDKRGRNPKPSEGEIGRFFLL